MKRIRNVALNVLLIAVSAAVTLLAINFLFRTYSLHLVAQETFPRSLLNYVGHHFHTFYPAINDRTLKNWNAILGDSHAAGAGDEFLKNEKTYGWMHFLRATDNENYYVFGRSGFGSVNSAREFVLTTDEIRRSRFYPEYEPPRRIIFVFYEGNDLNNNLTHFSLNGKGSASPRDFIRREIEKPADRGRSNRVAWPVPMLLRDIYRDRTHFLDSVRNVAQEVQSDPADQRNHVFVDDKRIEFPIRAQSAAVELTEAETELALNVFFESLRYLKEILPGTPFEIVYLPSVVTVYRWDDPVQVETYHTLRRVSVTYRSNLDRSRYFRRRIGEFASGEGMLFIDCSDALIAAGSRQLVHGPLDFRHFNRVGQQIIADTIHRKGADAGAAQGAPRAR